MSAPFTQELLTATGKLRPEADGLGENAEEWILGMIAVPKSTVGTRRPGDMPTYRRGWTFRLEEEMDFIIKPFTTHQGEGALAVVLRGSTEEYFAGWFRESRREDVAHIVSQLNHELDAERNCCRAEDTVSVTVGSDFAPDAPWGSERVTVWADGRIAYVRRESDGSTQRSSGSVGLELWDRVSSALARTGFPEQPDIDIYPGGGPPIIEATGAKPGRVVVDGLENPGMEHYRGVVEPLVQFATAVRSADNGALATLGFKSGSIATAPPSHA